MIRNDKRFDRKRRWLLDRFLFTLVLLSPVHLVSAVPPQGSPPAPSVSLSPGGLGGELKVSWAWNDGGTGCLVNSATIQYKKTTSSTWNIGVLDFGANNTDAGVYTIDGGFGNATSFSKSFVIGPSARGYYQADGERGVTLENVDYHVRVDVYSNHCGEWSSYSSVATGRPKADTAPAFADGASVSNLNLTQHMAMSSVTLPAATGGNGALTYNISPRLPDGLSANSRTLVISGTPTKTQAATTYTYRVHDQDGNRADADADTLTFTIAVAAPVADTAPAFASNASISNLSLTRNAAMSAVTLPAATGGNGALSYAITPAPPSGLSFNASTRTLSGTPTVDQAATSYTYRVSDGDDNTAAADTDTLTFTIAVAAPVVDTAPSFASNASISNLSLTRNAAMSAVTLPAATGGNGALSYAITPAPPSGLSFNASTRTLSGTPTVDQTATSYTYSVSDGDDNTAAADEDALTFTIAVAAPVDPDPPVVVDTAPAFASNASISNLNLTRNTPMSAVTLPAATGGDGALSYAITPAPPSGLSFNASTRTLSGTPTVDQPATSYTYRVSDGDDNTAAADEDALTFTIAVAAPADPDPPVVVDTAPAFASNASISDLSLIRNTAMSAVTLPAATGGDGALSYAIIPAPPSGLSFNASTRTLSGTPTVDQAARFYTYRVSDGDDNTAAADEDALTFTIAVFTAGITVSPTTLSIAEGATAEFAVVLDGKPVNRVSVSLGSDDAAVTLSPSALEFTSGNWNVSQTVTASAAQDADTADETVTVTIDPSGADYDGVESRTVTIAVTDDDEPGLALSVSALTVEEGGGASFTVALATQPDTPVTVTLQRSDAAAVTLSPSALEFTSGNWNVSQTVTASAAQDADTADETVTVTIDPSGADYDGVVSRTVTIAVADDDEPGLALSVSALTVEEGGGASFTVALATQPDTPVTVTLQSSNSYVTLSSSALEFTSGNWNAAQTVTASAAQDADTADETVTVTIDPSGADYDGVVSRTVTIAVADDDEPGLALSESTLTVEEGGGASFTVALATQPDTPVTVTLQTSDAAAVTLRPSALVFTSGNWNVSQTVTASAVQDDDSADAEATVTVDPSGADYDGLASAMIAVTVNDDDEDTSPVFDTPVAARVYEPGAEITPLVLPAATGGNGVLAYSFAGDLPAGLGYDAATRTISGTPSALAAAVLYALSATDADGDKATLSFTIEVRLAPAMITVQDAPASDGVAPLQFTVRLSRPANPIEAISVRYATEDGTGRAGEDYTSKQGELRFPAGSSESVIEVPVLPAPHVSGVATVSLRLSGAQGAQIEDGLAEGSIERHTELPDAWVTRFGRVASDQATQAIYRRLSATRRPNDATVGGTNLSSLFMQGAGINTFVSAVTPIGALDGTAHGGNNLAFQRGPEDGSDGRGSWTSGSSATGPQKRSSRDWISLSSFQFSSNAQSGASASDATESDGRSASWAVWGDAALTRFDGTAGAMSLQGDVLTATLGVDRSGHRWLAGLALSHSDGDGNYRQDGSGKLRSRLTSLVPYLRLQVTDFMWFWGAAGYGLGDLRLTPNVGSALETDLRNTLAAVGARTSLHRAAGADGAFELAMRSDLLWSMVSSEVAVGLREASGTTTRARIMIESAGELAFLGGALQSKVEGGLRHDGGDAETGAGYEVGAGLGWRSNSFLIEANARKLLRDIGDDDGYEEEGYNISIMFDPGAGKQGPRLILGSTWGIAQSGLESVWIKPAWAGAGNVLPLAQHYRAKVGYSFGKGRLWHPYIAMDSGAAALRSYRIGLNRQVGRQIGFHLEAGRKETATSPAEEVIFVAIQGLF